LKGDKKTKPDGRSYKTQVVKGKANPQWIMDNKFTLIDATVGRVGLGFRV
jgi:hypothetical protein